MSNESFNWHEFLGRWQEEWVLRPDADEDENGEQTLVRPGLPGADEAAIVAAEERLGRRLPPSYRGFLAASDGWHVDQTAAIYQLGGAADIDWFQDPYDMTSLYEPHPGDDPREKDVLLAGMWRRALRLETDSDMSHALLDPGDSDQDGEWALYVYKGWSGEVPDRYPSFRAYMEAMYRGFHGDRAAQPDFVNATTLTQDAHVDEAHLLALRGRHEEAMPLLEEAFSFGRPRSAVLLNQLRQLLAPSGSQGYGNLVADPLYLPEILPLEAMQQADRRGWSGGDEQWLRMTAAWGVAPGLAEAVLNAVRDGTHQYAPPGPWGRAVAEAREVARWGATDAAWHVLRDALPLWEAPGPLLIVPLGLLADPVLGPLITPERGREILATPRAGETGPAPEPVPDLDPPGLAWLAGPFRYGQPLDGYRCVWVEGADPASLPALIGEEGAELSAPVDLARSFRRAPQPHEREGVELWEDRAVVAAGHTAEGWAFAFDGPSHRHLHGLFLSPATAASSSGRAVVVWSEPRHSSPDTPAAFHVSVAEHGQELYAFTVQGTEIQRSGAIPEALDPARLFRPQDTELVPLQATFAPSEASFGLLRWRALDGQNDHVAERVRVREIDDDEGRRLLRIVRRGTGSVVTWRRAQMVLLSAQSMPVAKIAEVTFTSADRVRDVIHNFNSDGFDSLYPKYKGGRPRTFTLPERREIKKIAKSKPAEHGLPFSTWSLAKLADFLVAEGVVDDISHEGLRVLLREEGVSFQRVKTWKTSRDPDYAAKKARVEHLYAIADGEVIPEEGEPEVVFCMDEFGPLNLQPHPGRQWAEHGGRHKDPGRDPRPRRRATYTRPHGVRHLFAAYDLAKDQLYGHIKKTKNRSKFLEFCRYLRSLHPADVRIAIVCDNYSPHLTTKRCQRVGTWAAANNVEIAYTPTNSSWLNRIEAQFTALRYFALDGTDHPSHKAQGSMIRRYIIWRNKNAGDHHLREVVTRANVA